MKKLMTNPKLLLGDLLLLCFWTWFYFADRGHEQASPWVPKLQLAIIALISLALVMQVIAIYRKRNTCNEDLACQT